ERWAIELVFVEDGARTVLAGQVLLKQALWEARPEIGDQLSIELIAITNSGGKTLKRFKVSVTRKNGEVVTRAA
ncbi:MAG: hypothetical protein WCQ77_16700, partial [Planctomycetota bacterium]